MDLMDVAMLQQFYTNGKYKDVLENASKVDKKDRLIADSIVCKTLLNFGEFDKASDLASKTIKQAEEVGIYKALLESLAVKIELDWVSGNLNNALDTIKIAEKILSEKQKEIDDYEFCLSKILIHKGNINSVQGDIDKAQKLIDEGLSIGQKVNDMRITSFAYLNLGNLEVDRGNALQAITYFEKCLEVSEKFNIIKSKIAAMNNIAHSMQYRGKVVSSLNYLQKAMKQSRETNLVFYLGSIMLNLGNAFSQLGNIEEAFKQYKESNEILNNSKNYIDLSEVIVLQTITCIELDKLAEAKRCSQQLQALAKRTDAEIIQQRSDFVQAITHCHTGKPDINECENSFLRLIKNDKLDSRIVILSKLHLAMIFINQFMKGEMQKLKLTLTIIDELRNLTLTQNTDILHVEILRLKAKIHSLVDVNTAILTLTEALSIAKLSNLRKLEYEIVSDLMILNRLSEATLGNTNGSLLTYSDEKIEEITSYLQEVSLKLSAYPHAREY